MEFNWQTKDGINLFGKEWKIENPKAVIILIHGFGEHIMRYDGLAQYYNAKGYALIGCDHRGHGQSAGLRGHTPDYQFFMEEIDDLIEVCQKRYPSIPVVIYGHSMGGNIALNYMLGNPSKAIKKMIVTSPWISLMEEPSAFMKWVASWARKIIPTFSQGKKIGTYISRVQEEVDKYVNDPLNHGTISLSLAHGMFESCRRLIQYRGDLPVPALIMHAGDDLITSRDSTIQFCEGLTSEVEMKIWPGLYHEIHNESIREQVYDFTIDWLDKQLNIS